MHIHTGASGRGGGGALLKLYECYGQTTAVVRLQYHCSDTSMFLSGTKGRSYSGLLFRFSLMRTFERREDKERDREIGIEMDVLLYCY
jgi:hypothetical protein